MTFLVNLIATKEHKYLNEIIHFYSSLSDRLVYTDFVTGTTKYADLADALGESVVKVNDEYIFDSGRFYYQMAWHHLTEVQPSQGDWILSVHADEMVSLVDIVGKDQLTRYQVLEIPIMNNGEVSAVEPRFFRFYHGGCDFSSGNIWPDYVEVLRRRKFCSKLEDGMVIEMLDGYHENFMDFSN